MILLKMRQVSHVSYINSQLTQSDETFFIGSVLLSLLGSSLRIIDLFCFTDQFYVEYDFGTGPVFFPVIKVSDEVRMQAIHK